jgi:hypothetical protein
MAATAPNAAAPLANDFSRFADVFIELLRWDLRSANQPGREVTVVDASLSIITS